MGKPDEIEDLKVLRNQAIMKRYRYYYDQKEHGVRKFNLEWILNKLKYEFFLTPGYIQDIIQKEPSGGYGIEDKDQIKLPL